METCLYCCFMGNEKREDVKPLIAILVDNKHLWYFVQMLIVKCNNEAVIFTKIVSCLKHELYTTWTQSQMSLTGF